MWDSIREEAVETPEAVVSKIGRAFDMWAAIPGTSLEFEFAGLVDGGYASTDEIPTDGRIHIVLDGTIPFTPINEVPAAS